MTNPDYTYIAIVVDSSGSMNSIKSDTEGGINNYIKEQAKLPGVCRIKLATFDTEYTVVRTRLAKGFPKFTLNPKGMTALFDAIGKTITDVGAELSALTEDERPAKVIIVIMTDGAENSSQEYVARDITEMIKRQTEEYSWDFVFLGANQDAVETARNFGISRESALTYSADAQGVSSSFDALATYSGLSRAGKRAAFTDEDREKSAG